MYLVIYRQHTSTAELTLGPFSNRSQADAALVQLAGRADVREAEVLQWRDGHWAPLP
jgi:hypothetical protein